MTISFRLNAQEAQLITNYAKLKKQSVSEIMRTAIIEKIEDEIDLMAYEEAMAEHLSNPQTYSFDEMWKMINEQDKENE